MEFTKVQTRILQVLADGKRHEIEELRLVLRDAESRRETVNVHLSNIRKQLHPIGQDIICEWFQRKRWYKHVRMLHMPYIE